jgi:hypothetical protein
MWNSNLHSFAQLPAIRVKEIFLICAKNTVVLARVAYPRTPMNISESECSHGEFRVEHWLKHDSVAIAVLMVVLGLVEC